MPTVVRLISLGGLLLLCACDVQLSDAKPAEYPANHDLGMYEVSVAVTRDALVTPGSVYVRKGGGWQGSVQYRFVTVPSVQITNAHIEPQSSPPEDAAAGKLSGISSFPVVGGCDDLIEVRVASSAPRSHGTLSIDTNDPADPHWQARVEFSPK